MFIREAAKKKNKKKNVSAIKTLTPTTHFI